MDLTENEALEVLAERWRREHKRQWIVAYSPIGLWLLCALLLVILTEDKLNVWLQILIMVILAVPCFFPIFRFEKKVGNEAKKLLSEVEH